MNKIAHYIEYYRNLGSQYALTQGTTTKTAGLMPSSRMGKATLGALGIGGGIAAAKAMSPEPSMVENMYEGGKDMLSDMSQEDMMGYANLLQQMSGGGGYSMGYDAGSASPVDYSMSDLGDPYASMGYDTQDPYASMGYAAQDPYASMGYVAQDPYASMGYEAQMSPEEMAQYMAYYQ